MKEKTFNFLTLLFASLALFLVGCGSGNEVDTPMNESDYGDEAILKTGTLYVMLNPEMALDYDEAGLTTDVRGMNADGEEVLENYTDYIGKETHMVLEELILQIGEAGYFESEIAGEAQQIVIELETGSALPNADFLQDMAASAQRAVEAYQMRVAEADRADETAEIDDSQAPEESQNPPATVAYENNTLISMEQAKQAAYAHAGVPAEQVIMEEQELEVDDGLPVYTLEFYVGPDEYEYEIHGLTGEVLAFHLDTDSDASAAQTDNSISVDQAKQIAFDHAGVDGSQAYFEEEEWDEDDGVPYYSFEFSVGEAEYEYEIHAVTGDVLDFDHDLD